MREADVQAARDRSGVVPAEALGAHPGRAAVRNGLQLLLPRAYLAATQPVAPRAVVDAITATVRVRHAFRGWTALWLYGAVAEPPQRVEVCVPHSTRLDLGPVAGVKRVAPAVLLGARQVRGHSVVALEMAVVQAAAGLPGPDVLALLERLLRERRTTIPRLRGTCRRGLAGSAAVRAALDELVGGSLDAAVRQLRRALERRGVTGLEVEVRFVSSDGASCYADLLHRPTMTALEMDGPSHLERQRFRADRRRDRWMHAEHGVLTVRIDVSEDVEAVADEVVLILERRVAAAA